MSHVTLKVPPHGCLLAGLQVMADKANNKIIFGISGGAVLLFFLWWLSQK